MKNETAPFDGVLLDDKDFSRLMLKQNILNECEKTISQIEKEKCSSCESSFKNVLLGLLIGTVIGGGLVISLK